MSDKPKAGLSRAEAEVSSVWFVLHSAWLSLVERWQGKLAHRGPDRLPSMTHKRKTQLCLTCIYVNIQEMMLCA